MDQGKEVLSFRNSEPLHSGDDQNKGSREGDRATAGRRGRDRKRREVWGSESGRKKLINLRR
jgi:hypothetical protein